jgi:HlyD family secretion protein
MDKKAVRRRIKWVVIGGVLAGLAVYFMRPQPVGVDLGEVVAGPLRVMVEDDGQTRVREPYEITMPLAGVVRRIDLEPGDVVRAGDVLAVVDPVPPGLLDDRERAEAVARAGAAAAAYERAKQDEERVGVELEQAKRYVERDQERFKIGNISAPMLEDTRQASLVALEIAEAAEAAVRVGEYELAQARAALAYTRVTMAGEGGGKGEAGSGSGGGFPVKAPIDGRVLRRYQRSEASLAAGTTLFELGDAGQLEVHVDVLSQDAVKIRPGQEVVVEHWGGKKPLAGRVRRVEPAAFTKVSARGVDEQRVFVVIDFVEERKTGGKVLQEGAEGTEEGDEFEQKDAKDAKEEVKGDGSNPNEAEALGDAYRVEVGIVVWEEDEVLKVPASALFRTEDSWAVYADAGGVAELREVEIGESNGFEAQVLGGLQAGDRVVRHPNDRIEQGVALKVR